MSRHQITTDRLILRPFKAADADVVVACLNDFQVSRWLSRIAHPFTHADLVLFNPDGSTMWPARVAITLDGSVVGGMGALDELGYWLAPEFWGQGIATEAARAGRIPVRNQRHCRADLGLFRRQRSLSPGPGKNRLQRNWPKPPFLAKQRRRDTARRHAADPRAVGGVLMPVATASFLVFAASQVGTPGPANMALLASGAKFGLRRSLPFIAGVILGKQLIIWPLGFGLMSLAATAPLVLTVIKWISIAVVLWVAWRIANTRLSPGSETGKPFNFWLGLLIHPFNPKAWAMITAGFTSFVDPGTPTLQATATVAICLFITQAVLHPIWTLGGDRIARLVAGTAAERTLMWTLAGLTVLSVLVVLFQGGNT
ncbi:MAG: GNAT family N-acetyltransferase [Rhodobacteraceae bacterium]|nr:GNAT family N-acetyltransferase [Paracoccaceae bacterium]